MQKDILIKLIIKGLVGMTIGIVLGFITISNIDFLTVLILGIFFSGLPYGWEFSGKIIGGWLVLGSIPIMICAFLIRAIIALLVGWIAYPIALICAIVKMIRS